MARKNDLFQRGLIIDSIYFTYNQPYHGTQGLLGEKKVMECGFVTRGWPSAWVDASYKPALHAYCAASRLSFLFILTFAAGLMRSTNKMPLR